MSSINYSDLQRKRVFQDDVIFRAEDLSIFEISDENREVSLPHLARLVKAVKEKDLLPDFPILVTTDFTIIDGQHRYLAAMEMGLPIWFKFATVTEWGDVGFANNAVKKWTLEDYLRYWVIRKSAPYIRLQEFLDDNQHMTLGITVQLMSESKPHRNLGDWGGSRGEAQWRINFQKGTWKIESYENAETMSQMLFSFKDYYSGYSRVVFANAVFELYLADWYDHARMIHQFRTYGKSVEIKHATRKGDYMEMLEYAYNYNRKGDNRVVFPR